MTSQQRFGRTVGEVSVLLGVSVRALHHWEAKGLVAPAARTGGNYRLYSDDDIARLQQVMIYRACGMGLDAIAEVLDSGADTVSHLLRQRSLLMRKESALKQMVAAIDELLEDAMDSEKQGLSVEEVAVILENADFPAQQAEAEEKYGDTDDWKTSAASVASMSKEDWRLLMQQMERVEEALERAMREGVEPGSARANELAEEHRELISAHFPVSHSKQVLIARGYVEDPRFRAHYDQRATGLASWLKAIIDANAQSHGIDPDTAQWQ